MSKSISRELSESGRGGGRGCHDSGSEKQGANRRAKLLTLQELEEKLPESVVSSFPCSSPSSVVSTSVFPSVSLESLDTERT